MKWIKKQFTRQNVILLILIALFAHNYYLQSKIEIAINTAIDAEYEARMAKSYASEAANNASDAAYYASEAATEAENASSNAKKAYRNSFGYQCWSCP